MKSYNKVTQLFVRQTDLIYKLGFSSGTTAETTWNHPFWVSSTGTSTGSVSDISSLQAGKWIEAKDLQIGDESILQDGRLTQIQSIEQVHVAPTKVYNIEVEDFHTYFVGEDGVLVHNQSASYFAPPITGQNNNIPNEATKVVVDTAVSIEQKALKISQTINDVASLTANERITTVVTGFVDSIIDSFKGTYPGKKIANWLNLDSGVKSSNFGAVRSTGGSKTEQKQSGYEFLYDTGYKAGKEASKYRPVPGIRGGK